MKKIPHIVADADIPFLKGVLEPFATINYLKGDQITNHHLSHADALIVRTRTCCNAQLLDNTDVRLIATATIGTDHIDLPYCLTQGIQIASAKGCNARGVLQYVMAALAEISNTDRWTPQEKTLGVVGVGSVGSLIAQYGKLFGFRVILCDPPKALCNPEQHFISLNDLLPQADIVTCHVPLTSSGDCPTLGMANEPFFKTIKQNAIFINTSRGKIMDDTALIHALKSKRIKHAVIDTWNGEPSINPELLSLATLSTPHIAGYSLQGKATGTALVVHALSLFFGVPLKEWFPAQVAPSRPDTTIRWTEMCNQMPRFFNIREQSNLLKKQPLLFEDFRNNYDFRTEFF